MKATHVQILDEIVCGTFSFLSRGIILLIELPQPENTENTCTRHTETLDSCFDLFMSHPQRIL